MYTYTINLRLLFKPSEAVMQKVDKFLTDMKINRAEPYAAAHLRLGGFKGDALGKVNRYEKLVSVLSTIQCAKDLAESRVRAALFLF